ncbi:hypothetical protein [Nostoc sp.]|uniref:hypothetical protein n=1 Tax=Nostoc sp. TaxID=1180 RepID=UPI002FFCDEBB
MKLPIQAQPIIRISGKVVGITANIGVFAAQDCGPGKDCPAGYWCCCNADGTDSICTPCQKIVGGHCAEDRNTVCGRVNKTWCP